MTGIHFIAIPTAEAKAYRAGKPDANGQAPERHISDGSGNPCRHCLNDIAEGEPYLVLSHRPFDNTQPYAEQGPIFLHTEDCPRYADEAEVPAMFQKRERFLIRGYNADNRIVYGTGSVVETQNLEAEASRLFDNADVDYVHLRSGSNGCFQCRIDQK